MEFFKYANLCLRFLIELCALTALGYWGFYAGKGYLVKIILGIGLPLLAAVIWGMFVSPKASIPTTGIIRFLLEICVLGAGGVALYAAKYDKLAILYAIVMMVNLTFTYLWKQHSTY
ncbi:YrdB family protein [Paenibacillus mendelii]|uniref:YrdB family protein n=1 Tax=Paenibacillus mendelii TaxID=206163 RepID=A0ABV6JEG1_9BACL|nr:YrdB family protein [Paenibacillus mendelii]MCQ6557167.1 YrdB family protein [Paenibacillus mendelii]